MVCYKKQTYKQFFLSLTNEYEINYESVIKLFEKNIYNKLYDRINEQREKDNKQIMDKRNKSNIYDSEFVFVLREINGFNLDKIKFKNRIKDNNGPKRNKAVRIDWENINLEDIF